jgi:LPXTG-motif cell wall-anchored protein
VGNVTWFVVAAAEPLAVTVLVGCAYRLIRRPFRFYAGWIGGSVFNSASFLATGPRVYALGGAANALLAAFLWWLSRRRRKRAPRSYGAKARALLAAIVSKAREVAKPRPVLRPGGVRV